MAIYHCNISVASRADGASAVAGSAYLSRSKMTSERDGQTHDFRRAHQHEELVRDLGVALPEHAPERWRDRSALWNEVETVEKKADAQLARRIEYALPDELPEEEKVALAERIVADRVADGHVVDACIHRNRDGTNWHVHMLEPLRPCDERGFLPKSENVYTVRDPEGNEREANAAEFKELKEQGYEKVYKWRKGNEWRQLTATEAERDENAGFKRQGKTPVQKTHYLNNGWNDRGRAEEWRKAIADRINEALAASSMEARVDHRSYERQGIERVPQLHEGSRVKAIEARERQRAQREGYEYKPVTARAAENAQRRRADAVLAKAREGVAALGEAIRGAAQRAADGLADEMAAWRDRIERARAILFQSRQRPSKAVSRQQAGIYAGQSQRRLRVYQERLCDPMYRHAPTGVRDLTKRERSFLTPAQDARYAATRKREVEAARAAEARRRAEWQTAQQAQRTRPAPQQQQQTHQRGMSR